MRVFSWNVQGRIPTTLDRQLERVLARCPDLITLQEVTAKTRPLWGAGLTRAGYHVASTEALADEPYPAPPYTTPPFPRPSSGGPRGQIKRKSFNLCAARGPLILLAGLAFPDPDEERLAFPEKYLAVGVDVGCARVELHNAHLPPGVSRGVIKVHHFEAIRRRVESDDNPKVLCGDFNAPWSEDADGPLVDPGRGWPDDIKRRWFEAESALFDMPRMRDAYRAANTGTWRSPVSHFTSETPHRYDYIFASDALAPTRCIYLSEWLERDASGWRPGDHAPVEADFELRG